MEALSDREHHSPGENREEKEERKDGFADRSRMRKRRPEFHGAEGNTRSNG
jgi:hypothetical protein